MYWRFIQRSALTSQFRFPMLVFLLVVLFTASSFAAPLASTIYDGTWSGTTSQGRSFSFSVANDAITSIATHYVVPGCTIDQTITLNLPITGNTFSVSVSNTTIQGTFSSLVFASGTVQFTSSTPNCSGVVNATWSATRPNPPPPITSTPTHTPTTTSTPTVTHTPTPTVPSTPAPLIAKVAYVPSVLKLDAPTQPPPTLTPTVTPTQPPPGQRPRLTVTAAREETELRCSTGIGSYMQRPNPGYTFVIVNFKVFPPAGQSLSFNRSDVSIVGSDGVAATAQGDNIGNANTYCLGGTAMYFIPGAEASYSFVFVPLKETILHDYRLRFPNAVEVVFTATPK